MLTVEVKDYCKGIYNGKGLHGMDREYLISSHLSLLTKVQEWTLVLSIANSCYLCIQELYNITVLKA